MKSVFILQHSYELSDTGEEEIKFIGVYSTMKKAQEAIERLSVQPGFKDLPDYFYIDEYKIDQDNWSEGFITERYEPIWAVWRQDDNGQVFLVKNGLTETDALRLVREFDSKGDEYSYWAKENL
jgi:hypothetical protein